MENPVQDIIIGNVSGALGAETQTNKAQNVSTDLDTKEPQTYDDMMMNITEQTVTNADVILQQTITRQTKMMNKQLILMNHIISVQRFRPGQ